MAQVENGENRIILAAGGIYTAQSLIGGLTFLSVPTILRGQGTALAQIGLVSLVMAPWALKFLWAPWVEGLRRPRLIITLGEIATIGLLLALAVVGDDDFTLLLGALALLAMVAASVDIACDGLLISQLAGRNLGGGNAAQVGGGYLGMVFGGALFTLCVAKAGWPLACLAMAALVALFSLPMAVAAPSPAPRAAASRPSLRNALGRPVIRSGIALTLCAELGGRVVLSLSGPFLIDHQAPLAVAGLVTGLAGIAAGLCGAGLGAMMVRRWGAAPALRRGLGVHLASLSALAALAGLAPPWPWLVPAILLENLVMAAGFVTLYAHLMRIVSPKQPGVDFTLFQCSSVAAALAGGYGGAWLAGLAGYGPSFATAATLAALGAGGCLRLLRGHGNDPGDTY